MKIATAGIKKAGNPPFVCPVKSAAGNIHSPFLEEILH